MPHHGEGGAGGAGYSFIVFDSGGDSIGAGSTRWMSKSLLNWAEARALMRLGMNCIIDRLYVDTGLANVAPGETLTVTFRVNGLNTALGCVVVGGTMTASDLVNAVALTPADYSAIRVVSSNNGGWVNMYVEMSVRVLT